MSDNTHQHNQAVRIAKDTGLDVYWSKETKSYCVEGYSFHFVDKARQAAENIVKYRR